MKGFLPWQRNSQGFGVGSHGGQVNDDGNGNGNPSDWDSSSE